MFVKIFKVSVNEKLVNKERLSSFQLKNFYKVCACMIIVCKKESIWTSQPCLHNHVYILSSKQASQPSQSESAY